eukprot:scaffold353_cov185-Amphora_coffeaeformis.AAC.5
MKGKEAKGCQKSVSWRQQQRSSGGTKQMQLCLQWPGSTSSSQETASPTQSEPSPTQTNNSSPFTTKRTSSERRGNHVVLEQPAVHNKRRRKNQFTSSASSSSNTTASSSRKSRLKDPQPSSDESTRMWIDKYAPNKSMDVVVAPKKTKEVQAWLEEALFPGNPKFLILVGSPGIGKSTLVQCLAKEMNLQVVEWRESVSAAWQPNNHGDASTIEYESPIQSFEDFLTQNTVGYNSLSLQGDSSPRGQRQKQQSQKKNIILLQDLPYCHGFEAEGRLRESLTSFARTSMAPTVLIFSDVAEGKHRQGDLEKLVDPSVLYSQLVRIMTLPGATKARMKKCIEAVAKAEGLKLNAALQEDLHVQSGGDIRHALMTLQFDMAVGTGRGGGNEKSSSTGQRDQRLSAFHALGKLLYAKRDESKKEPNHDRAPLQFDPEHIVEESGMEVSRVMEFVRHSGPEFFTDVDELCGAWAHLSDASLWMNNRGLANHGSDPSTIYPTLYASSLTGRTVASHNRHPAESKFRQLAAPPVWSIQARQNWDALASQMERQGELGHVRWSVETSSWAQERVSYLQMIRPNESIGLQSFFSKKTAETSGDREAEMAEKVRKEQEDILRLDDIDEFSDEEMPAVEDNMSSKSAADLPLHEDSSSMMAH